MYCLIILTFVNWNYSTVAIGCEKNSHVFIVLFCLFVFVTSLTPVLLNVIMTCVVISVCS